jgi:hypothetical protein
VELVDNAFDIGRVDRVPVVVRSHSGSIRPSHKWRAITAFSRFGRDAREYGQCCREGYNLAALPEEAIQCYACPISRTRRIATPHTQ